MFAQGNTEYDTLPFLYTLAIGEKTVSVRCQMMPELGVWGGVEVVLYYRNSRLITVMTVAHEEVLGKSDHHIKICYQV